MASDRSSQDNEDRSWLEKLSSVFSSDPQTKEELENVLEAAIENDLIDEEARIIIEGAIQVSDMRARDIMVPRSQMVVIRAEHTLTDLLPMIIETAHSRYPVIGESSDDVMGILLVKDLLPLLLDADHKDFDLSSILRPVNVVPESKRLNVLLREFRENRNHMAIVIDEYGGVAGLITIEDVLEEIVGEIEDETDAECEEDIRELAANDFIVQAQTPIDIFNQRFGTRFSDEEFDTIGGLVIQAFGHMPARQEHTTIDDMSFTIIKADKRRLHSLRLRTGQAIES